MKQTLDFILISLLIFACKAYEPNTSDICEGIEGKFTAVSEMDTTYINELQYHCVRSALLSKKVMFDKFGRWDYGVFPGTDRHHVLFWDEIQLFKNDTTTFTIAAYGKEEKSYMYSAFMVLDHKGNDVLIDSVKRNRFNNQLYNFIKNNNKKKQDFYEEYWNSIDPIIWKKIQNINSQKPKN